MRERVLVGIPTLNGPDRLGRALASVVQSTDLKRLGATVLVSDDGSEPRQMDRAKGVCAAFGVEMLTTERRLGIAAQWNRLTRHFPEAEIIALLNDDVEVVPDWLDVLVYSLERNRHAGAVGLRCLTGTTKAQYPPTPPIDYVEARLLDGGGTLLSTGGACFGFRRDAYDAVGGFDERYFCLYEELDFCVALLAAGYVNLIASYPVVYHTGGETISANSDAAQLLAESREKFRLKWSEHFPRRAGAPDGESLLDRLRALLLQPHEKRSWLRAEWNSHVAKCKEP
jgi:GT2 family glycosyltransferase